MANLDIGLIGIIPFMKRLGETKENDVLEPCFGQGAFIKNLLGSPTSIDACDIDKKHFEMDYNIPNCEYYNMDFIDYFINPEKKLFSLKNNYDSVICNPPYGLNFTINYRNLIKKKYPDLYAKESYALFFYFAINLLKKSGRYVFIIPDTFLTSKNLSYMREFIVGYAKPTHIIQFKSKRFGSVNFGYGNMCIISGNKN